MHEQDDSARLALDAIWARHCRGVGRARLRECANVAGVVRTSRAFFNGARELVERLRT